MSVADLSGDRVEERIGALEEGYTSFPVNQTTLSVAPKVYERARERCSEGLADVYVQVYDDGDVLLVERDDEWVVPHAQPATSEQIEAGTCRSVAERTGVECRIADLERVTIIGVRDDEDPDREPVYRIVAVFSAERTGGSPADGVAWHSEVPDSALPEY